LEVQMGKLGLARKPDDTEAGARLDAISGMYCHAAAAQVRVLRFPAIAMLDHYGITGLAAGNAPAIRHAVAHRAYAARGCRDHRHALPEKRAIDDADVGAFMAVIAEEAAAVVARRRTGIAVDMVLHNARHTDVAGDGQPKRRRG